MTTFLDEQAAFDGAVANYAYISASLDSFLSYIGDGDYSQALSDLTGYNLIGISLYAIPERYLSVIDEKYYFPNSF